MPADITGQLWCRFPIGGDTMSVTSGVVSRIEVTSYTHGATALLGMQIDAGLSFSLVLLSSMSYVHLFKNPFCRS